MIGLTRLLDGRPPPHARRAVEAEEAARTGTHLHHQKASNSIAKFVLEQPSAC